MKVIDNEGKEHSWNLTKYVNNQRRGCSDYHKKARKLIKREYPFEQLLEEVPLPGTSLFADFYIHSQRLMIEVQGEQHTNFVPFFHKDKQSFGKAKLRDKTKRQWCENNGIRLIEFCYNETEEEWKSKLLTED